MKKLMLTVGVLGLLFVNPNSVYAQSRGISTEDFETGQRNRNGTYCKLSLEGDTVYDGLCNVAIRDTVTVIDIGRAKYRIERDAFDNKEAEFYRVGSPRSLGKVYTTRNSPCWVGDSVKFCAK